MDQRSYAERLDYIVAQIEKNRFRTTEAAATYFGCSTRTVKRMLNHLRDQGHNIIYNRLERKYYIKKDKIP